MGADAQVAPFKDVTLVEDLEDAVALRASGLTLISQGKVALAIHPEWSIFIDYELSICTPTFWYAFIVPQYSKIGTMEPAATYLGGWNPPGSLDFDSTGVK